MMRFAKQWVLRSLDQAGYRLLKKADHDALQAAAAAAHGAPAAVPPPPPPPVASISPSALDLTEAAGADAALAGFLHDAPHGLAPPRALALYRVVQYLARAGIAGEIVDCGHGATTTLAAIAAASMSCGETNPAGAVRCVGRSVASSRDGTGTVGDRTRPHCRRAGRAAAQAGAAAGGACRDLLSVRPHRRASLSARAHRAIRAGGVSWPDVGDLSGQPTSNRDVPAQG